MRVAYVDTSAIVAIGFKEAGHNLITKKLRRFQHVFSHHLLEAEIFSSLRRERYGTDAFAELLAGVRLVFPDQSLSSELDRVFQHGYIRGADALHLATALWLAGDQTKEIRFISLDRTQSEFAEALGFSV